MKHTISFLVENQFGVLSRVSGLFSGRGFNIDSLSVGVTNNPEISRMTIVVKGDDRILEQVMKQLNKLINVIRVLDVTKSPHIEREMVLVKVATDQSTKGEILRIVDIFRAKVVDVSSNTYTVEVTGTEDKINAIIELLDSYGIKELARTGKVPMLRGPKSLTTNK
ncbi:MAG: acetolactate synthase small subunit [bacterium]